MANGFVHRLIIRAMGPSFGGLNYLETGLDLAEIRSRELLLAARQVLFEFRIGMVRQAGIL
jgi:hypothetical protein